MNLTKEIKEMYIVIKNKNKKTPRKEIEANTNKWNDITCSWIRRINIVLMSILPKMNYRSSACPIKISMAFFIDRD